MMSKKNEKEIVDYIQYLQGELRLGHWQITVCFVDKLEVKTRLAQVERQCYAFKAKMSFPKKLYKESVEEIQATLVHEMLHLLQNPSWDYVVTNKHVSELLMMEEERFVEQLAQILSPKLKPLELSK